MPYARIDCIATLSFHWQQFYQLTVISIHTQLLYQLQPTMECLQQGDYMYSQ